MNVVLHHVKRVTVQDVDLFNEVCGAFTIKKIIVETAHGEPVIIELYSDKHVDIQQEKDDE